jgi:hypothetical protein
VQTRRVDCHARHGCSSGTAASLLTYALTTLIRAEGAGAQ